MKKTILFLTFIALAAVGTMQAEKPYKHSIGVVVGNMEAVSYKMFLNESLALEVDFGFRFGNRANLKHTRIDGVKVWDDDLYGGYWGGYYTRYRFSTLEVNPNLMIQKPITEWGFADFYWYAGGGASLGFALGTGYNGASGKFGVNAMGGAELAFKKIPLTCGLDFRPGFGLLFGYLTAPYFDWTFGLLARYVLGK